MTRLTAPKFIACIALAIVMTACSHNVNTSTPSPPQTPQYKAAVFVNDFASSLQAVQDIEKNGYANGLIDFSLHSQIEMYIRSAAQQAKIANAKIKSGDIGGAQSSMALALSELQQIKTNGLPSIKSAESKANLSIAVDSAIAIVRTLQQSLTPVSFIPEERENDLRPPLYST